MSQVGPEDPRVLAAVEWAEQKALGTPAEPPRHPVGGAGHVTPDERLQIQMAHLTDGLNQSQLAAKFGRTREAVARCLKGEEFEKLKADVWEQVRVEAVQGLRGHVDSAVRGWGSSIGVAAQAGNHKPAKELLEATGVIEREPQGSRLAFQINIGMPGSPAGPDPFEGRDIKALIADQTTK